VNYFFHSLLGEVLENTFSSDILLTSRRHPRCWERRLDEYALRTFL